MAAARLLLEGVSKSPEAQERLLNGIVDFHGVTEEERGCAVRGVYHCCRSSSSSPGRIGNHVSKTLRHCRRFDSHLSRHDIARQLGLQIRAVRRVPEFLKGLSGRLPQYSAGIPGVLRWSGALERCGSDLLIANCLTEETLW